MSVIIYSNGIVEEFKPSNLVFSEEELLHLFKGFKQVKSKRLIVIPNVWCLWGEMENPDPIEFNRLCTDIIESYVFSHVVFIHDSEINHEWNMTDMIYKNYVDFKNEFNAYIDAVAQKIVNESEKISQEKGIADNMILLQTAGQTDDKKVIYTFNPEEQTDEFYKNGSFSNFSDRIFNYWMNNEYYGDETQFIIFEDKKVIITVLKENLEFFFNKMIKNFEVKENYETCSMLKDLQEKIVKITTKKKRGRPRKTRIE